MKVKRRVITILIVLIAVFFSGYFYILNTVSRWENRVYPKSYINGLEASGKTYEELLSHLSKVKDNLINKGVSVRYEDKNYKMKLQEVDGKIDVEQMANKMLNYGKNKNTVEKYWEIMSSREKNYSMDIDYNEEKIRSFVKKVSNHINKDMVNASIKVDNSGNLVINKEGDGLKLNEDHLYKSMLVNLNSKREDNSDIIPVVEKQKPKVTEEQLKNINTLVSSFYTRFSSSSYGRKENIKLAVSKLNGVLIMPGEEFSFNKIIGPRTGSNGFRNAPIIIKNKLEDGVGGGVCQVSTTLYNAIIRLNIKSTERQNHSLAPAYVAPGFDATVSDYIDYKFINTLKYPIYIQGSTSDGRITFNVYSNSTLLNTKYKLVNEIVKKSLPVVVYNKVNTLPTGVEQKVQDAVVGYKVRVYLVTYDKNNMLKKEQISTDFYHKVDGIINVGI